MASSRRTGTNESKWSGGAWSAGVNSFGTAGGGRDYTSLTTWETDTDVDIVTATVSPVLECYRDATSYAQNAITFSGATTNATYRRFIRAASGARHAGVSGAGILFTGTGGFQGLEDYFALQDVEIVTAANSSAAVYGYAPDPPGGEGIGLLLKATNAGSGLGYGAYSTPSNRNGRVLANCIVYECEADGYSFQAGATTPIKIYNCTSVNNGGYGFTYATTQPVYKNCIGYNNTTADWNGTGGTGTDYNLSKDASAPGTNNFVSKTLAFSNAAADDYRLAATDTDAINVGTSLAADTWAFDDDIAFTTRPSGAAWDVGAHEYVATGRTTKNTRAWPLGIEVGMGWRL